MNNKNFSILEYKSIYCNKENTYNLDSTTNNNLAVPQKIFTNLKQFVLKNNEQVQFLKPTYKKGFGEVLQAQNYVGIIQTRDGITIEILPKIQDLNEKESKNILIKMLKTLRKTPFKNFNMAHLKTSKMPLFEIFIKMFLEELSKLIKKGIKSDYITKEENLNFLKGKLKISEQIKRNSIHKERFFLEYQEFSPNRIENKLIKTTLEFLYKNSKLNSNQKKIREFLFVFAEIETSSNINSDFNKIKNNRQMKDYEQILLWCKTFLLKNAFSPYKGNDIAFALLFDMNLLFESFVGYFLKKNGLNVSFQDKGKYLVESPKKFALKPDFVINVKDEFLIADTKWKIIKDKKNIMQSDMYQLYAYGMKYENCEKLYLIYPYSGKYLDLDEYFYHKEGLNKLALNVLFFDISSEKPTFFNQKELSDKYMILKELKNKF